jgi:glycerol-3-phosphate dehydrogenase
VVDLAMEKSERSFMPSRTGNYQLTGNELQHPDQLSMFNKKIHALENEFGKEDIESLKGKYGYNALPILESALAYPNDTMRLLKAELHYCIDNEGVIFPGDFLTRRTGRLLFEPQSIEELFPVVLNELTAVFSWDEATRKRAAELFEAEMKGAMVY